MMAIADVNSTIETKGAGDIKTETEAAFETVGPVRKGDCATRRLPGLSVKYIAQISRHQREAVRKGEQFTETAWIQ